MPPVWQFCALILGTALSADRVLVSWFGAALGPCWYTPDKVLALVIVTRKSLLTAHLNLFDLTASFPNFKFARLLTKRALFRAATTLTLGKGPGVTLPTSQPTWLIEWSLLRIVLLKLLRNLLMLLLITAIGKLAPLASTWAL